MSRLMLDGISKSFGGDKKKFSVLSNIGFEAQSGEFIVLVGPSGCGKSTLLRIIAGLESADSGSIKIGDRDVTQIAPASRDIAMVFQDYALYPHMSVQENLSFGLRIQNATDIEARVSATAAMLDLTPLLGRKPSELSGGQRQRVAIGRAIVRKPAIFLFDEPLSNLDAKLRSQTRIELAALHKQLKNTVVYVTHDQAEAMTLADRIIVLDKGTIQQFGSPLELYNCPANTFVATFIGNPNMNLLQGEAKTNNGKTLFRYKSEEIVFSFGIDLPDNIWTNVTLGLRPEALKVLAVEGREAQGNPDIQLKTQILEKHGHETHLIGQWQDTQLVLRSANPNRLRAMHRVTLGETIAVTIDQSATHWFCNNTRINS